MLYLQNLNKSVMGRHKKAACEKCLRIMRQDNIKRHMKVHENGKFANSLFSSTTSLNSDSESNFSSISSSKFKKTPLNEEAIIKTMKMDAAELLELGRIVVEAVKSMGIREESLRSEYKKAKDLYLKHVQTV